MLESSTWRKNIVYGEKLKEIENKKEEELGIPSNAKHFQ